MNLIKLISLITFLAISNVAFSTHIEISENSDSLVVTKTAQDFFKWYIETVKNKKINEYQPTFIADNKGMTTLDFSKYFENLRKLSFTESFIETERKQYQECLDNLEKIEFKVFNSEFDDLDEFENIKCDFSNSLKWTGGQEIVDGFEIKKVTFINQDYSNIEGVFFFLNSDQTKSYSGKRNILLRKTNEIWKIDRIEE